MTLRNSLTNDLDGIFFNLNDFAEEIIYNGITINAVIDRGQDLTFEAESAYAPAKVWVKKKDFETTKLPELPKRNDIINFDNLVWRVDDIVFHENHVFELFARVNEGYSGKV